MENRSFSSVVGSPEAPYESALARQCGLATDYHGVARPSLPNYLAATGGSTFGVGDDGPPAGHPLRRASIFGELSAAHRSWAAYEESMPGPCDLESSGEYAVKHDPAAYFVPVRAACARFDVPMGTTASGSFKRALSRGALPALSFVTPNLCDDGHDCATATADSWLSRWVPAIVASPAYARGDTVVLVVWDEGQGDNHVPLIVVGPSVPPGTRATGRFDHYSLLRTTAELLGVPAPGRAARAPSMAGAFSLAPAQG